jgi:hypothetical protein
VDDEQAEDDPSVSPTDEWLLAAGDEGVVVHAGAVEDQPSSAAEGVIDDPKEGGSRSEHGDHQLGEFDSSSTAQSSISRSGMELTHQSGGVARGVASSSGLVGEAC